VSATLAKQEISARMRGRKNAVTSPNMLLDAKRVLHTFLSEIGLVLNGAEREIFFSTAVDLLPFGSYNAELCYADKKNEIAFILLDSGVIDFAGNLSALYVQLRENKLRDTKPKLSKQEIIDYIWSSGLIFFEKGLSGFSKRDAIFAPKLNFSEIDDHLVPIAFDFSMGQEIFLVLHEFGHFFSEKLGGFKNVVGEEEAQRIIREQFSDLSEIMAMQLGIEDNGWQSYFQRSGAEKILEEQFADIIAFGILERFAKKMAASHNDIAKLRVGYILNGVDLGLSCMRLMQHAFPLSYDKKLKFLQVRESFDHPLAGTRRDTYRNFVSERLTKGLLSISRDFDEIFRPYEEAILDGAMPSDRFHQLWLCAKTLYDRDE
jgi:hypothetical protein